MSAETGLQNSSRKRIIFLFTKALLHRVVFARVTAPLGAQALCSASVPSGAIRHQDYLSPFHVQIVKEEKV